MRDTGRARKPGWFCGAAVDLSKRYRWMMFALLLLLTVGLCYSQFGILAWGDDMAGSLNLVLFLVPAALCIVMLGVVPGLALAFAASLFIMLRVWWTPTTGYDFHLADTFLSVSSVMLAAILMAAIVTPAARRWPADLSRGVGTWHRLSPARIASIVIGCLAFSFAFSYASRGLIHLVITPGGEEYGYASMIAGYLASLSSPLVFVEAVLNGAVLSVACVASVAFDANRRSGVWRTSLASTFNRWLALVLLIVFVLASLVSFCVETSRAMGEAESGLLADLAIIQLEVANAETAGEPVEPIVAGRVNVYGGEAGIVRDHVVVSSSNPDEVGKPASELLSSGDLDNFDFLVGMASDHMLTGTNGEGAFVGLRALVDGNYVYVESMELATVFRSHTATLMYNGAFMLVILVVVFAATRLLMRRVVVEPMHRTNDTLERITAGELSKRVNERSATEFDELSTGINTTVGALRDMMDEVANRNAQDLAAAKTIQESALPREFPPFPDIGHFDIYASMKTAKEVGGDFYDFFLVDDERLAFLIADVAGKGIPASLFMMAAKTQLRDYLEAGLPIEQAVDAANHQLCNGNDAGMFVTCWVGVLNYLTGELSYVNAGHNPPLLNGAGDADPSHDWRWVREVSGMPLGLFDGIPYDRHDCLLSPGDTLYLYTDGVTEAISAEKAFFGEERLVETLERYTGMNARSVSVGVRRAITDFTLDAEQSDDITMLSLRYGVPPEKRAIMVLSAETGQLIHVQNFIHEELHRRGAPKSAYGPIDIAAEELFVNTCRYAYPDAAPGDPGEVRIEFEYEASPPSLTVTISDDGVPFDPLTRAEMDAEMDAFDDGANALAGGMGIEMARRSVDDMRYERVDGCNVLTFRKGW
jgi:serine phosphatase RsbU (regulator of sigma subunit)/anti-sigma regulatory factor (Ser/Thr protein kinase)